MSLQVKRNQLLEERLQNLRDSQAQLREQLDTVKAPGGQRRGPAQGGLGKRGPHSAGAVPPPLGRDRCMQRHRWDDALAAQLDQLLGLDLTPAPALAAAVDALRPTAQAVLRPWPAMAAVLRQEAMLDADFPAFELESFDADLVLLEYGITRARWLAVGGRCHRVGAGQAAARRA
jgi:hypothetical protein